MRPGWPALLQPPVFEDPAATDRAAMLHWMLFSIVLTLFGVVPVSLTLWPGREIIWPSYGVVIAASLLGLALVRRGNLDAVGIAFPLLCWLVLTGTVFIAGGTRAIGLMAYPVVVLIAGFTWGGRAAFGFAVLSSAVFPIAWWLESQTHFEPGPLPAPGQIWTALTAVLIISSALLNLSLRGIRESIESARRNERKYAELIEETPDAIALLDEQARIVSANPAVETLTGRAVSELLGKTPGQLGMLNREDFALADAGIRRTLAGASVTPFEVLATRPDGSSSFAEVALRRFDRGDRSIGIQFTVRDRTEQRLAEQERKSLEQQLAQSQKLEAVGQLAGGVAHDFNNYLTVILGNATMLEDALPADSPLVGNVSEIESAAKRSAELTQQLLAFSRQQILQTRIIDLNGVVNEAEALLGRVLGDDIRVETRCKPDLWPVRADPTQVETMLVNLAVNARDAMPGGGKLEIATRNTELDLEFASTHPELEAGDYVVLEVADTGRGMDADTTERIFEPFFTTKPTGSGLGLSTLYGIVRQSGGTVTVESQPGQGTRFSMYLPRAQESLADTMRPRVQPHESDGTETILLVEDEPRVRSLATAILEKRGYRVLAAGNGAEALRIAEAEAGGIDLMLTDVTMPAMSGPDLARELSRLHPKLPILFMSGYPDQGGPAATPLDADACLLQKPFTVRELSSRVRQMLDDPLPR